MPCLIWRALANFASSAAIFREVQKRGRQREVDVFREPFNHAEHLRQRSATLEHQAACELRLKQDAE